MAIKNLIIVLLILIFCAGCKKKYATIVDNSGHYYTKNSYRSVGKYDKPVAEPKQLQQVKLQKTADANIVMVGAGDTLYSISKKYNTNLRDLIDENHLTTPYALKIGSQIKIPQIKYHEVKNGDTLYSISRQYNMNLNELVALNNLASPYQLNAGQKIKISNSNAFKNEIKEVKSADLDLQGRKEVSNTTYSARILDDRKNNFAWPTIGPVISRFGPKSGGLYNDGINIRTKIGQPIKASEKGVVAYVGNELKGYGNLIILKHSDGWITAYGHLSQSNVKRGQKVDKLQTIALAGSTGNVDSSQLYFGLRKGRDALDPQNYLKN